MTKEISMEEMLDSIDLTPTWISALPVLVEVAANGSTREGREAAWGELRRLARIVDAQVEAAVATVERGQEAKAQADREEACWSKHWNDGSDICVDCGADLQGEETE